MVNLGEIYLNQFRLEILISLLRMIRRLIPDYAKKIERFFNASVFDVRKSIYCLGKHTEGEELANLAWSGRSGISPLPEVRGVF